MKDNNNMRTSFHKHATRNELAGGELGVHWTICVYCCFSFLFRCLSTLHLRIAFLFHDVFLVSLFVFISSVLINQNRFLFHFLPVSLFKPNIFTALKLKLF